MNCGISFELFPNQDGTWDVVIHNLNEDANEVNELQNTSLDNAIAFIRSTMGTSSKLGQSKISRLTDLACVLTSPK